MESTSDFLQTECSSQGDSATLDYVQLDFFVDCYTCGRLCHYADGYCVYCDEQAEGGERR